MRLTTLFILFFTSYLLNAQSDHRNCGHDQRMEQLFKDNPGLEQEIEESYRNFKIQAEGSNRMFVEIPVHVIIVHPPGQPVGSGNNLSLDHVLSQIDVLNEDFGRYNSDAGNTPPEFPATDSGIQFCLASVDPNGNFTDGVTRFGTNQDFDSNEFSIKSQTGWDRDIYLNIWVAPLGGNLLGYAYLPSTSSLPNPTLDGVVVTTSSFGGQGFATGFPYHLGRTATHEVGHFLGLRHIWRSDGCGADDGIADTPLQDIDYGGCPSHPTASCGSNDMFMNYMDYVFDDCMNAFSTGQGQYMNTILSSSRSALANASGYACGASNPLALEIIEKTDPLCNASFDGIIEVLANGGTGSFTYTLTPGGSNTTGLFTGLEAGGYTISVDDGSSSIALDITLDEPALIGFDFDQQNNTCPNAEDGLIEIFPFGGSVPNGNYMYQIDTDDPQDSPIFENIGAGVYQVYVIDENECSQFQFITVLGPDDLLISYPDTTKILCGGDSTGAFSINVSGGTPGYTYSIGDDFQGSNVFDSLPSGDYNIMILDGQDCLVEDSFNLAPADTLVSDIIKQDVNCFGFFTGEIIIDASGGASPYSYVINSDTTMTDTIMNLSKGTYFITTLDTNGCADLDTAIINEPTELTSSILDQSTTICGNAFDGFANVMAMGGTPPYNYMLGTQTNTDGKFTGLPQGLSSIIIRDANGCLETLPISIGASPEILLNIVETHPLCNGDTNGSIIATGNGGTGTLSYQIDNETPSSETEFINLPQGDYLITAIDDIGCENSMTVSLLQPDVLTYETSVDQDLCGLDQTFTLNIDLLGGTPPYAVTYNGVTDQLDMNENSTLIQGDASNTSIVATITDGNGCISDINETIILVERLDMISDEVTEASCDGSTRGSVAVSMTGGTPPYVFELEGETNATGMFVDLLAGAYQLTGTDVNNCSFILNVSIPTSANGFQISSVNVLQISCTDENDGMVNAAIAGGIGPFTFTLNGVESSNGVFDNLSPGNYTLVATDVSSDCSLEKEIEITNPPVLEADVEVVHGANTGSNKVVITPNGGTPPYKYALDDVNDLGDNNEFNNLEIDNHTIYVVDANGCVFEQSITITNSTDIEFSSHFTIFPNPADNQLNIRVEGNISGSIFYELLDINGRQLISKVENAKNGVHTISLNDLSSSIYVLKIIAGNQTFYRKIYVK